MLECNLYGDTKSLRQIWGELPKMFVDHPDKGDFWSAPAARPTRIVDGASDHAQLVNAGPIHAWRSCRNDVVGQLGCDCVPQVPPGLSLEVSF